ncbi:DUF6221 family protein [Streptomyces sp. bgisy154]|uniref:DUF6221 family protein n=1 Tax=Streptomyces sp. bgisy154 TaxID=3413794 RepID=UPI003D75C15D
MVELVEWLRAQLAEDERIARAATPGPWAWTPETDVWDQNGPTLIRQGHDDGEPAEVLAGWGHDAWGLTVSDADKAFIAAHDPARVLREVAANRRRLERHTPQPMIGHDSDENDPSTYVLGCSTCQVTVVHDGDWPCEEVRDMLVSYEDRPGYREEWRP